VKAAVIRKQDGRKFLAYEQMPDPVPGTPTEVLVQVAATGICGSDLHGILDAEGTSRALGLIIGHESAGQVIAVGSAVTRVAPGDRVAVDPQVTCGVCVPCSRGWRSICVRKKVTGSSLRGFVQGSMAELMTVDQEQLFVLPDNVPYPRAALAEPLSNALHVVSRIGLAGGELVVVLGAGPLGLCLLSSLRAAGVQRVVVTDVSAHRRSVALGLGAEAAVGPAEAGSLVAELTGDLGADVVVESVGIDATYTQAIEIVRRRGKVMFFGAVQPTVTMPLMPVLHKELQLIGCTGANEEMGQALDLLAAGTVNLDAMITHQYPLAEADQALSALADASSGSIKVQVTA
jgi:2-desacetyl-2-hydroxyethyl bacteriochlorophyllide A dehydrogenase